MKIKTVFYGAMALYAIFSASQSQAQTNVGQWDFENKDLSQTAGADLGPITYYDGPNGTTSNETIFGATTALNVPNINGEPANIMRFPGDSTLPIGYLVPTPPAQWRRFARQ